MKRIFTSFLLLLGGLAIFVLGNPYYSVFPTNGNKNYSFGLAIVFLISALALKRTKSLAVYAPSVYSLFVATAALFFLNTGILNLHNSTMPPLQNLAVDKFSQFLHIVPLSIALMLLAGNNLKSIFIHQGNLKQGLKFGLISFAVFALISIGIGMQADVFTTSSWTEILWLLLFIFANATMEELWLRGIFLRNYEAIIGRNAAIFITAAVFGASHINATYDFPGGGIIFGLLVFVLGVVGAHAMLKDDSVIGPVLFHAGYDLLVIVPVLNSL